MRTLCDGCEGAAAILFCAADEAALCRVCDAKVHMCNKLASRHIRVGLDELREVPRCDICESAPAFFYCETDGSSLCLQCDMTVHVGGKRTHKRYLLLRQRVEFPGDKPNCVEDQGSQEGHLRETEKQQNHWAPPNPITGNSNMNGDEKVEDTLIDLNTRPLRLFEQAPNNQEPVDNFVGSNHASENAVPGYV